MNSKNHRTYSVTKDSWENFAPLPRTRKLYERDLIHCAFPGYGDKLSQFLLILWAIMGYLCFKV